MADETTAKEALQVVYTSVQRDYEDLEEATVAACQGAGGEGGQLGSSLASRLRSLGDRVAERLRCALRLGVQKALGMVSTHYFVDFEHLATGYIVPDGDDDAKVDAMEQADAGAEGATTTLAGHFEADLFPDAAADEDEGEHGEGAGSNL